MNKKWIASFMVCLAGVSTLTHAANAIQSKPDAAPEAEKSEELKALEAQQTEWLKEGRAAAESWLQLVDKKQYGESWEQLSQVTKRILNQKGWSTYLNSMREALGTPSSRTWVLARFADNPKNVPPGKYMILNYETSFKKVPEGKEMIFLYRESDGRWRIFNYQAGK
jgi:hypothetical protein